MKELDIKNFYNKFDLFKSTLSFFDICTYIRNSKTEIDDQMQLNIAEDKIVNDFFLSESIFGESKKNSKEFIHYKENKDQRIIEREYKKFEISNKLNFHSPIKSKMKNQGDLVMDYYSEIANKFNNFLIIYQKDINFDENGKFEKYCIDINNKCLNNLNDFILQAYKKNSIYYKVKYDYQSSIFDFEYLKDLNIYHNNTFLNNIDEGNKSNYNYKEMDNDYILKLNNFHKDLIKDTLNSIQKRFTIIFNKITNNSSLTNEIIKFIELILEINFDNQVNICFVPQLIFRNLNSTVIDYKISLVYNKSVEDNSYLLNKSNEFNSSSSNYNNSKIKNVFISPIKKDRKNDFQNLNSINEYTQSLEKIFKNQNVNKSKEIINNNINNSNSSSIFNSLKLNFYQNNLDSESTTMNNSLLSSLISPKKNFSISKINEGICKSCGKKELKENLFSISYKLVVLNHEYKSKLNGSNEMIPEFFYNTKKIKRIGKEKEIEIFTKLRMFEDFLKNEEVVCLACYNENIQ